MSNILEINGVSKRFDGFALQNISFSLPKGFIMGFVGPNGAGKTTTIKLILNMLLKESGCIKVFGMDHISAEQKIKEKIGVVMDQPFYVGEWSLLDVEKSVSVFYSSWNKKVYRERLDEFSLRPEKRVKDLSRGMAMKLMIAVALSHEAQLLILDEPTSGLDAVARNELMNILSNFISDGEKSILFSTHITSDLEKVADYITFISDGKIVYTGEKENLMEQYCLVKGGQGDLNIQQKNQVLGYREHSFGFDGILETSKLGGLPSSVIAESASLDEIILRLSVEGEHE